MVLEPTEPTTGEDADLVVVAPRFLVYGQPGVGKTTLACAFPRPVVIDADEGLSAHRDVRRFRVATYQDLQRAYAWLANHRDQYGTVVVDSISELERRLLLEIVAAGEERDRARVRAEIVMHVPEQVEYLANQRRIYRFLVALVSLAKPIVLTAGVRAAVPMDGTPVRPDVSPGLGSILGYWADVIGELLVKGGARYLVLSGQGRVGKSRFPSLPPHLEVSAVPDAVERLLSVTRKEE